MKRVGSKQGEQGVAEGMKKLRMRTQSSIFAAFLQRQHAGAKSEDSTDVHAERVLTGSFTSVLSYLGILNCIYSIQVVAICV